MPNCAEQVQIQKCKAHAYKTPKTACYQCRLTRKATKQTRGRTAKVTTDTSSFGATPVKVTPEHTGTGERTVKVTTDTSSFGATPVKVTPEHTGTEERIPGLSTTHAATHGTVAPPLRTCLPW